MFDAGPCVTVYDYADERWNQKTKLICVNLRIFGYILTAADRCRPLLTVSLDFTTKIYKNQTELNESEREPTIAKNFKQLESIEIRLSRTNQPQSTSPKQIGTILSHRSIFVSFTELYKNISIDINDICFCGW